jgi:hypothetical protein
LLNKKPSTIAVSSARPPVAKKRRTKFEVIKMSEEKIAGGKPEASRPEFYRLPKGGGGDPYFGFTRTFYYEGEKRGYWKLARIRERGKLRGITLVPFDIVSSFVRSQAGDGAR